MDDQHAANHRTAMIDFQVVRSRSDGIDFLRGVLALWVVATHLGPWSAITGHGSAALNLAVSLLISVFQSSGQTHPAVLGFIVLSGYCIHRAGFRRSGGSIRHYAIRRFFRIWPVYVLACLLGVIGFCVSRSVNPPLTMSLTGTASITATCVAAKITGLSALLPSLHTCSFEGNAPLTTVMVEMWLYAVYAAAIFLCFRRGLGKAFLLAVFGIFVIGVIYVSCHQDLAGWWHNGSLAGFLLYWWLGAAFVSSKVVDAVRKFTLPIIVTWGVLEAILLQYQIKYLAIVEVQQIFLALIFGLLIAQMDGLNGLLPRLGARIGRTGYSLYAFHAPLLVLILTAGGPWWFAALVAVFASLILHRIYECPLDAFGKRLVAVEGSSLGPGLAAIEPTSETHPVL